MRLFILCLAVAMPVVAASGSARNVNQLIEQINRQDAYSVLSEQLTVPVAASNGALTATQIEAYLNHVTTMVAEFAQYTSKGEQSTGRFYLSRPGKLRWEYDPPVPLVIAVQGTKLTMLDKELDQLTFGDTEDHLAALLTKPNISLVKDVKIVALTTNSGVTRITLVHPTKPETGKMTLVFKANPLQLEGIEVEDVGGMITSVQFSAILMGGTIDKSLFVIRDPRIFKKDL